MTAAARPWASSRESGRIRQRLRRRSWASVGLLEEGEYIRGELFVVVEKKAVRRIGIDLDPRIRREPRQEVRVAGAESWDRCRRWRRTLAARWPRPARAAHDWRFPTSTRRRIGPDGSATSSVRLVRFAGRRCVGRLVGPLLDAWLSRRRI